MIQILKNNEAIDYYKDLLGIYAEDVRMECKMFLLRQMLESIVQRMAQYSSEYQGKKYDKEAKFSTLLKIIFEVTDKNDYTENLRKELLDTKNHLNENVHEFSFVYSEDFKKHLRRILDFISYFSGAPIPNKLEDASRTLEKVEIKRSMDIIILNEFFDHTATFSYNTVIFKKLLSMIKEKNSLGFGNVNFHLISYMPSTLYVSSTKKEETTIGEDGVNIALDKAIKLVKERISKFKKKEPGTAFKPMLLWICNKLPQSIDSSLMENLHTLSNGEDGNYFSFHPVVIHESGIKQFSSYDKKWTPKVMVPQLIENFIFGLLISIQRAELKNKI